MLFAGYISPYNSAAILFFYQTKTHRVFSCKRKVDSCKEIIQSYDNLHFTEYTTPTLSSMAQPKIEMAHTAVDMALARIADKTLPCEQKVFASVLKKRQSSTEKKEF